MFRRAAIALVVVFLPLFTYLTVHHVNDVEREQRARTERLTVALCHSAQDRYDTLRSLIDIQTAPVVYPPTEDRALKAAEDARNAASVGQRAHLLDVLDGRPVCPGR